MYRIVAIPRVNTIAAHAAATAYYFGSGVWADNGSLTSISDSVFAGQSFSYDHLNRLTGETITSGSKTGTISWTYDAYGNRLSQSASGRFNFSGLTQTSNTYNGTSLQNGTLMSGFYSNRMDGVNHDQSGNVLSNGTMAFTYDAASRIAAAGSTCYLYNAEGMRTAKGTALEDGICSGITNQYILGQNGEQVAEFSGVPAGANGPISWLHSNVYNGGHLVATYDPNGLHFHFTDWLGTNRIQMNANGTVEETCLSLPFGDSLNCSGPGSDATEHHFTGKEHDNESGLDYFGARYYESNMGRWMSPDWSAKAEPVPYAKLDDPQSLNLYGYVGNNPMTKADVDGHCLWDLCVGEAVVTAEAAIAITAAVTTAAATVAAWEHSPQGQAAIATASNSVSNAADLLANTISKVPNPDGQKGAPDHQAGVKEAADEHRAAATEGQTVEEGKKIKLPGSTRRPDVQTLDKDGRTIRVTEVERKPNSARNQAREAEYDRLRISHETKHLRKYKYTDSGQSAISEHIIHEPPSQTGNN